MIISRKKYEKLNDDLIDAKAKVDDAKKSLDEENKSMRATLLIKEQRDQYKAERDTLIDDIAVLKANISRLERQNAEQLALLKEFRKLIDYKLSLHQGSLMYREYRSKLDQLGVK
ncbi:hypothetical protein AB6F13_01440 [Staphylococcus saprophyticus]|uniref:hypothetical protein n=1 Tax=Staphylococcus saprophyticus TaxID=29385 RepID=UPI0034DD0D04